MQTGSTLGPYRIDRHLGDGGMGSVWLAEDTRLRRRVALKTLRSQATDEAGRERLMREARAAAALNHAHIAAVYDVIAVDGDVAIVLEYVEGTTLAAMLRGGALPFHLVLQISLQLTRALVAAHQHGVIHRDLKPANIIINKDGDAKVLDFGIARLMPLGTTVSSGSETVSAGFVGTPAYSAPEQLFTSAVDERADLYALGVMMFEMATGRRPFAGSDLPAMSRAKFAGQAPSVASTGALVPPAFDALVTQLLQQQPTDRPGSAAEVLGSLRTIAGERSTENLPRRYARRASPRWIAAALALTLAMGAALVSVAYPERDPVSSNAPVIAVLPLRNTSGDAAKDYLAAGLSESLIAGLASSPSLIVLSRAAVADVVKDGGGAAAAVNELGASYMIDGSVQQSGAQLRIAINLIRRNQSIAWGRTFDGTVDTIFELQTRMAAAVSEAMSAQQPAAATAVRANPSALEEYWRGRAFLDRWDVAGNVDAAIAAMQESLNIDPNFALAHAGLGLSYWQKYGLTRDQQFARLAIEAGSKAAALDPNLPEVHYALAVSLTGTGRRAEGIDEFRRAIDIRPTFDEARRKLATALAAEGKIDEAIGEFEAAIALRPRFWGGYSEMGLALFAAARYDAALKAFERVVELQPDSYLGYQQIGAIYQIKGDLPKAIAAYERSAAIRPSFGVYSNLGMMQHSAGRYREAIAAYRKAIELRPSVAALYRNVGDSYLRMGRVDEARKEYSTAIEKVEADLVVNPTAARTIAALAVYLAKAGRTSEALSRIDAALRITPDDVQVIYRAAVVNSLAHRPDDALDHIASALQLGYSVRAVQEDEDFAGLRSSRRFKTLTGTGDGDGKSESADRHR